MLQDSIRVLSALFEERYSTRSYLPDEVAPETLNAILVMAQRTASWCNTQPWEVFITRGESTRRLVEDLARSDNDKRASDFDFPLRYEGVYAARRRDSALQLYDAVGIARGDRSASSRQAAENFRLFGAPHVAIVTTPAHLGVYGAIDCGAWVSNFMLAAKAHGVASVAQAALASRSQVLRSHLGVLDDRLLVCGVSFGYSNDAAPVNHYRTSRAQVADAVRILS
jgi:nitroreductase